MQSTSTNSPAELSGIFDHIGQVAHQIPNWAWVLAAVLVVLYMLAQATRRVRSV